MAVVTPVRIRDWTFFHFQTANCCIGQCFLSEGQQWSCGVTVSTLDSEFSDGGSNPLRTFLLFAFLCRKFFVLGRNMTAVGFAPTRIAPPELEYGALDRSAKLSLINVFQFPQRMSHRHVFHGPHTMFSMEIEVSKSRGHYSLVVERQPCKLKVRDSIPSGGLDYLCPAWRAR